MSGVTLEEVNRMDEDEFVAEFGAVYETSPWVAAETWADQPFISVDEIHGTMQSIVEAQDRDTKLSLLRAHPDLGEQTEMTDASEAEQASAGLDQLTETQYEAFQVLNERYREKFGFPFIMAVRDETPDAIRAAMETRVEHDRDEEFQAALDEVHTIARLRLSEIVTA